MLFRSETFWPLKTKRSSPEPDLHITPPLFFGLACDGVGSPIGRLTLGCFGLVYDGVGFGARRRVLLSRLDLAFGEVPHWGLLAESAGSNRLGG